MTCRGLPWLCCDCRTCTHRRVSTSFSQVWADNVVRRKFSEFDPECPAIVVDMQARGDDLFILWKNPNSTDCHVQRWTQDGEFQWDVEIAADVPADLVPLRIDSDGVLVWVCADVGIFSGQKGFFCYDATDGTELWTKTGSHFDVDPDGGTGCFVAKEGTSDNCNSSDPDPSDSGNVIQYADDGSVDRSFGAMPNARAVLVTGGKLWVGSALGDTSCFCDGDYIRVKGCICRYSTTGTLELVCAGGEWVDGAKRQNTLFQNVESYVNCLAVSPDGHILSGNRSDGVEDDCLFFEVRQDTGAFVRSFDITDQKDSPWLHNTVNKVAVVGSTIYAVTSDNPNPGAGLLVSFGEGGTENFLKRHRGYLTGTSAAHTYDGTYATVTENGSDFFVGGEQAGCVLDDDDVTGGTELCDADQPCECGDFNTRGQPVIGECGCEDGVECDAYINVNFTGCLAGLSGTIPMTYSADPDGDCDNCTTNSHHWYGSTSGSYYPFGPLNAPTGAGTGIDCERLVDGEGTGEFSPCCSSLSMKVDACYDCGSGWTLTFCVTGTSIGYGAFSFKFAATVTGACNPPTFTFTWDGSVLSSGGAADDFLANCCGGLTGCGGFNATGCETLICGCSGIDGNDLTGTITNTGGCSELDGATVTLVQGMPGGQTWVGSLTTVSCFGTRTFTLSCNDTTWSLQIEIGSCLVDASVEATSANCDPFELRFTFTYNYVAMSACSCCEFAGGTFEVVVTL